MVCNVYIFLLVKLFKIQSKHHKNNTLMSQVVLYGVHVCRTYLFSEKITMFPTIRLLQNNLIKSFKNIKLPCIAIRFKI